MQIIPLAATPNQTLSITLNGQQCQINVYQRSTGLYFDLLLNGVALVTGVLCLNMVLLVRAAYLGFIGDIAFNDTLGQTDPVSTGLGAQYQLIYFLPSDL